MDPIDEIVEELLASAQALPESHPAPKYPKDHRAAMRVPKGGSSCASCEFLGKDEKSCTNKFFIAWNNGSDVLPFAADEFCSDWYEHSGIKAYGTSEGVQKAWDTRGRGRKEAVDYVKTVRYAKDADIESLNTWRKVATESYNKAPNADVKKNLRHASNVASWVVSDWEDEQRGSRTGKSSPFFVVDSPKHGIVGVINLHQSTTSGFDHVSTLVTRPDVIAGLTDERGVGTKLMIQAAKYAASRGNGLDLSSLSGAEGFYRKLGMHETPPVSRNGMSEFSWTAEETGQMAKGTVD